MDSLTEKAERVNAALRQAVTLVDDVEAPPLAAEAVTRRITDLLVQRRYDRFEDEDLQQLVDAYERKEWPAHGTPEWLERAAATLAFNYRWMFREFLSRILLPKEERRRIEEEESAKDKEQWQEMHNFFNGLDVRYETAYYWRVHDEFWFPGCGPRVDQFGNPMWAKREPSNQSPRPQVRQEIKTEPASRAPRKADPFADWVRGEK